MPDLTPALRRHDPTPRREARLAYLLENDSLVNDSNTAMNRMTGFIKPGDRGKESRHGCDHFCRTFRRPFCGYGQALSLFAANHRIRTHEYAITFKREFDEIKWLNMEPKTDNECGKRNDIDLLSEIIANSIFWQDEYGGLISQTRGSLL